MLEGEAIALEGAIAEASDDAARQSAEHDLQAFFDVGGPGEGFADAADIAAAIGMVAAGATPATGLQLVLAEAQALEAVLSNAEAVVDNFFVDGLWPQLCQRRRVGTVFG